MAAVPGLRAGEGPEAESGDQGREADGLLQNLRDGIHREYRRVPVPECLCHMIRNVRTCRRGRFLFCVEVTAHGTKAAAALPLPGVRGSDP